MYKIGDRIKYDPANPTSSDVYKPALGRTAVVTGTSCAVGTSSEYCPIKMDDGAREEWNLYTKHFKLYTPNSMSNLVKKLKLLTMSEPEKSFQKVGIQDENGTLTTDGQALFTAWLFEKNKAEFNTAVAQPLLAEQEKEAKK